ncbi:LPXTG cell wall anchor domain-containing protein [Nocardiopsis changdeensis]|uniref:LPXTG cell wall anchor domain-containing protein n=1 Tax=Nocardiopsis changdeensis TaxID=2831969 RepID=A0ABX8BRR5_9ACTN|nr:MULTISPECIES: LPXTG cell wall anchor domain-containing protein [Nocardiopsis]QUX23443.1 LPXTG cell wall anchor domain-containing protein [Nocardiopsis changdeensis]QYX39387.1 LPXTG cell wall anchor domain-containing protein [Nocardiopsis sp. MT53]
MPEHPGPEAPGQPELPKTGASAAVPAVGGLLATLAGVAALILGRRRPGDETG